MAEREFKLPDLGEGLTEGEVVRWLVAEGDAIALNQPIVEVETAKAVVEIPAPYAGTVVKLHASEGDTLDVDRHVAHRPVDRGEPLLHGHVHERWRVRDRMINVGVDVWDYRPVAEDELLPLLQAVG